MILFIQHTQASKSEGVPEQNPFDRNACAVVGFRKIGKAHSAIETLFGFMNFIHVMDKDSCNEMSKDLAKSYSKVAKRSMLEAAKALNSDDENLCNIGISCDGPWQKRVFSYLLGAMTIISVDTGKCLDYKVCPVYIIAEPKGHRCIQEVCKCNPRHARVLD